MYTLAAAILVCLAIAGQVQSYPHQEDELIRAEIQTVETALVMRLLQDEMAHAQEMECNSWNIGYKNILTDDIVKAMTNVFTHKSNNQRTYLYVPSKETKRGHEYIFRSNGPHSGRDHAEDAMYDSLRNNLPQEFWLTKTPCPGCAKNFITRYANENKKPVIRATHFYSRDPSGATEKEESIQCMAKMIKNGFTFLLWDWNKFNKDFLVAPWCTRIVSDAVKNYAKELKAEQDALLAAILKASNYAEELNDNELCM